MAIRREVLLIAGLLIIIAFLVTFVNFFKADVVESDAREFVLEDLQSTYIGSDIEIMTVSAQTNDLGEKYFEVKARVTENADGPCPERMHIFYNYPVQNFVTQLPEVITAGCEVCKEGICNIAFEEEAVIASHTFDGTAAVHDYIMLHDDATSSVFENEESWFVRWKSADVTDYYTVLLHRNGTIMNVTKLE